jgi:hypothetical protein
MVRCPKQAVMRVPTSFWNVGPPCARVTLVDVLQQRADIDTRGHGTIPLWDYIALWQKCPNLISQMPLGPECEFREIFEKFVALLVRLGVVSENEMERVFELTVQTARKTINVCPGLSLYYRWPLIEALDLDTRVRGRRASAPARGV